MKKDSEVFAVDAIKKMIISGEFEEDERLTETSLSQLIGLSRTPVRVALKTLEASGLLTKLDGRGYKARQITSADRSDAVTIIGLLEAQAAAKISMNGMSRVVRQRLETSILATEKIITLNVIDKSSLETYDFANLVFHKTIVQASENRFIIEFVSRLNALPGETINSLPPSKELLSHLIVSHTQHVLLKDAIESGDSGKSFALMQEHANFENEYMTGAGSLVGSGGGT